MGCFGYKRCVSSLLLLSAVISSTIAATMTPDTITTTTITPTPAASSPSSSQSSSTAITSTPAATIPVTTTPVPKHPMSGPRVETPINQAGSSTPTFSTTVGDGSTSSVVAGDLNITTPSPLPVTPVTQSSSTPTNNGTNTQGSTPTSPTQTTTVSPSPATEASRGDSYEGVEVVAGVSIVLITFFFIALAVCTSRLERLQPKLNSYERQRDSIEMDNIKVPQGQQRQSTAQNTGSIFTNIP